MCVGGWNNKYMYHDTDCWQVDGTSVVTSSVECDNIWNSCKGSQTGGNNLWMHNIRPIQTFCHAVQWIYGDGLFLIFDHRSTSDGSVYTTCEAMCGACASAVTDHMRLTWFHDTGFHDTGSMIPGIMTLLPLTRHYCQFVTQV